MRRKSWWCSGGRNRVQRGAGGMRSTARVQVVVAAVVGVMVVIQAMAAVVEVVVTVVMMAWLQLVLVAMVVVRAVAVVRAAMVAVVAVMVMEAVMQSEAGVRMWKHVVIGKHQNHVNAMQAVVARVVDAI